MALRRFYIGPDMADQERPVITGSDAGHIARVLRLSAGDRIELFDGTGKGYRARIVSAAPQQVEVAVEASFALACESTVRITLAQAMLKDRKMDDLIRQLTELGIHRWIPFSASRSIPSVGHKNQAKRLARWEKIAVEAVKQCRRGRIPEISVLDDFKAVLAQAEAYDQKLIFWEETGRAFELPKGGVQTILLVVGPEGGFDPEEIRLARSHGFRAAGLGPRILRAQTAALAACTLVQYCLGDMGR